MKPKSPPPDFSWLLLADPERVKQASEAVSNSRTIKPTRLFRAAANNRGLAPKPDIEQDQAARKAKRKRKKR